MKGVTRRQELVFAGAGLCGVCLYYLLENIALTYTLASNVGVILSVIPFFTAVLSHLFLKEERPGGGFYLGFECNDPGIRGGRVQCVCKTCRRYGAYKEAGSGTGA